MKTTTMRNGLASAAVLAAAISFVGSPQADAAGGYTLYGDASRANLSHYTLKLANTGFNGPTRALFQGAIDQIQANTNTRITIADGNTHGPNPGQGEIVVTLAGPAETCGSAGTAWDGCAGPNTTPGDGVTWNSSGWIKLKQNAFGKNEVYKQSLVAHELGHALGLDHHTGDASQLMHPTVDSSDGGTYKSGDIAGLQYLARATPAPA